MPAATHKLIAKHAVIFARECYEACASDNAFYAQWPDMDTFCRLNWHMFVPQVRDVFVDMLDLPDDQLPASEKAKIHEALCFDGAAKAQPKIIVTPDEPTRRGKLLGSTSLH